MSRVEPSPTDKGRFQATFSKYGHGKGNGKSRAAVYKHYNKLHGSSKVGKSPKTGTNKNKDTASLSDSTKTEQPTDPSVFVEIPHEKEVDSTKSDHWEDIAWLDGDEEQGASPTIPSPIRRLSSGEGELGEAHRATQAQLIRWGYMGIDRGLTHWGRGVMSRPDWSIERHPADYDALEAATTHAMDANGLSIQLSPTLVWGVVVAAAYAPPMAHIARNADPLVRRSILRRFGRVLLRPSQWFSRRRKPTPPVEPVERTFDGGPGDFTE